MSRLHPLIAGFISAAAGFVAWAAFAFPTPTHEAWDADSWWYLALPALGILSAVLGYLVPVRVWRWPLAILVGELAALLLIPRNDPGFILFPLAVPFALVPLAIGFFGMATIGAVFARDQKWDPGVLW
ncbi:MAG: hypothetical protein WDM94_00675 [Bauldia sp.]